MFEKSFPAISPVAFTAQGTAQGLITIASTKGFHAKQQVTLAHPTLATLTLEVKRVVSNTQAYLGPKGGIALRTDLSAYDTQATISAPEQIRPAIPEGELGRAVYEEEPAAALRVMPVDFLGRASQLSPLPPWNRFAYVQPNPTATTQQINFFLDQVQVASITLTYSDSTLVTLIGGQITLS